MPWAFIREGSFAFRFVLAIHNLKGNSNEFYSNNYITYSLSGLQNNDVIKKGEGKTFELTFSYNSTNISNNQLDSYLNFNFDYVLNQENEVDIIVKTEETQSFGGVTPENPTTLNNIANISFMVLNEKEEPIKGIQVDITYTTSTGSKQSAVIIVHDEAENVLGEQEIQFKGKQTNTVANVVFNNINIARGEKVHVEFDQRSVTNGQVKVSNVSITPIF